MLFADLGRSDEAVAAFQRSLQLDPVSCWNATIAGFFMYELGQEEAGRQQLQKAFDLDPDLFQLWSLRSLLHCDEGKFPEAIAEAQKGVRLSSGLPMARGYAAYALGMAGRRAEALAILDELEELSRQRYVPAIARAWCYLGLGDHERVIEWLEKGYEQRDSYLPHLRLNPRFQAPGSRPALPGPAAPPGPPAVAVGRRPTTGSTGIPGSARPSRLSRPISRGRLLPVQLFSLGDCDGRHVRAVGQHERFEGPTNLSRVIDEHDCPDCRAKQGSRLVVDSTVCVPVQSGFTVSVPLSTSWATSPFTLLVCVPERLPPGPR